MTQYLASTSVKEGLCGSLLVFIHLFILFFSVTNTQHMSILILENFYISSCAKYSSAKSRVP